VSHKTEKVFELLKDVDPKGHDVRYAGYFDLFNRGKFYEAHDVLEDLWLPLRKEPKGDFYKGLIQLAGALLKLAKNNLSKFAPEFEHLNLTYVVALIDGTMSVLENSEFLQNPLKAGAPILHVAGC
jgi:hypothetical protein